MVLSYFYSVIYDYLQAAEWLFQISVLYVKTL